MTNDRVRTQEVRGHVRHRKRSRLLAGSLAGVILMAIAVALFITYRPQNTTVTGSPQNYETFKNQLPPKTVALHIVGIGDSLTKGVGDPKEQGYAGMTVKELRDSATTSKVSFTDYGVRGDTTDDLLDVLKKNDVQKSIKNADIIFMTIGGNDLVSVLKQNFLNLNIDDFEKKRLVFQRNFNDILKTLYQLNPKITVYYLGLYNPFEDVFPNLDSQFQSIIDRWNHSSQTILELYPHTVFVTTYDLFKGKTSDLLYTDHFHPNEKGYQLISNRLLSTIEKRSK